jgi:hypothetical protein
LEAPLGARKIVGMKKRLTAGSLWFLAIWFGYEILWSVMGVPRMVGPMLAFVVASLVVADPAGLFWPAPARTATRARATAPDISASVLAD